MVGGTAATVGFLVHLSFPALVAGIDLATQEVRVSCADASGRVVATGSSPLPAPERPRPGWSQTEARAWWPATVAALRQATTVLGRDAQGIVAVAVAATSGTVVVVDGDGEPLGPALLYDDQRATAEASAAAGADPARWAAVGWEPGATSGLAKWGWLLGRTDVADRARFAWHASDVLVAALTGGPPPTDWSHALKSGYDPIRQEWATDAAAALRIPEAVLTEVRPPGAAAGEVGPDAAAATGLPAGCQVRLGMTDGCAGQVAAGADRPGRFVTVVGTTLVVKGATDDLVHDPSGSVYSHRHPGGWWLPGGASNTGGGAVAAGGGDLAALDRRAAERGPATCVTYPLLGTGERFPFVAPAATGFWLGRPGDEAEHHRALLEGVAFVERLAYAHLADLEAVAVGPVRSAGRGGRSPRWAAVRASVLGRPVVVVERADTAFGACVLAAAGTLHPDLVAAGDAMVGEGAQVAPADAEREALEASFARFVVALSERGWIDERLAQAAVDRPDPPEPQATAG
ncbi:MAG: FGGY-family carbohydrate kinase [Acidimicrobiales bacterium]